MKHKSLIRLNLALILLITIFCSYSCMIFFEHFYGIRIYNNADETILFYANYPEPDTSIANDKPILYQVSKDGLVYLDSEEDWIDVLTKDSLIIFIFSKDTVNAYSWETIKNDYNILKRYDLSIDDLEKQNWSVTYP